MSWYWRLCCLLAAIAVLAGLPCEPPDAPAARAALPGTVPPAPAVAAALALRPPASGLPVVADALAATGDQQAPGKDEAAPEEPGAEEPGQPGGPDATRAGRPDCRRLKCVALTFDDGPVPGTARLLALLRHKRVHATFFVLGRQAKAHPGILRRMVADGHVVGNHSWSHPEFWYLDRAGIRGQLARTDAVVRRATGRRPTLVRTPYGELSARARAVARSRGQALVQWDVDPLDWKYRSTRGVTRRVLRQARRGSIVLLHDVYPTSRHAVTRIVDGLRHRGYTLVTVPQLLVGRERPGRVYLRA